MIDTDHPELVEFEGETLGDTLTNLITEIIRLDAIIRDIESLIPENPDYVCEQILGACHRYMYPEEFGEVIE